MEEEEEEERTTRAREPGKKSPQESPLLDLLAAAVPDAGCGESVPPEVSKPKEEAAAAATSNTEEELCARTHFVRSEEDMVKIILKLGSSRRAPRCEHYLCENKVEKSSILVCIDCSLHFCIGDGTKNRPKGHARWHADLEQHCVGAFFDEPESLYCFTCERLWELEVSDMQSESDSSDIEWCGHFSLDEEKANLIASKATASKKVPVCQHPGCKITGKTCIMVCVGCNKRFCTRAQAKQRPFGHACEHAKHSGHCVGLWCSDPYTMYCFTCEYELALAAPYVETGMVFGKEAFGQASGLVKEHVCPIRGMPNLGNTCYVNALLQCLFVLRKLRARMLAPDVPLDMLGVTLKELFEDVNNVDNAQLLLNPINFLTCVRILDARFVGSDMQDSHELLCFILDRLDKEERLQMPAVAPTLVDSLFSIGMSVAMSCTHCSYSSPSCEVMYDISLPLPLERPPPKSIASPPRNISCISREKTGIKLFPQVDMSNTEIVQAIAQGSDSHITGLELGDVAIEKISEPLEVDSIEVEQSSGAKDGLRVPSQTQKDSNSLASIEECLALQFKAELLEWNCEKCSKAAHHPSTTSSKDGDQMMISTNKNTIDGDQTVQLDKIARQGQQSRNFESLTLECSSSRQPHVSDSQCQAMLRADSITEEMADDNKANKKTEDHEGVQEAVPRCLPTEKPANQLSDQGQNADQVDANQREREDRNQGGIKTRLISKLPPVLVIHLKRALLTGKVRGHVSFEEILDVGRFMDPSSEDKHNSSYRLVGVIEHQGPSTSAGHWIAYVRQIHEQHDGGYSSWYWADGISVNEASLEEVLMCEAQLLFYDRIEG